MRNGELTERGLARLTGVSQPHMHNLLKGTRALSAEIGDRILYHLRLSALDLVDTSTLRKYLISQEPEDLSLHSYLPVLNGRIGPSHPWPTDVEAYERFPIARHITDGMFHPVVARAADDVRMHPLFADGDLLLLDQSHRARTEIDPDAIYVIKRGRVGLVRRLRLLSRGVYMACEDGLDRTTGWERLPVEGQQITHFVRARAQFVSRELEWTDPG